MEEEKNANHPELFLELFENPISPLLIYMVSSFVDKAGT